MCKFFLVRWPAVALAALTLTMSGCERIKSLAKKPEATSPADSGAPSAAVQAGVSELTQAGYADFIAQPNAVMVVDFHADWCGPCKMLAPVLEKAVAAHPGVVHVGKVDVDKARDLAAAQKVQGIPDVRIFKNGREVDRFVGFPGEGEVLAKIAALAADVTPAAPGEAPQEVKTEIAPMDKDWLPPGMQRR